MKKQGKPLTLEEKVEINMNVVKNHHSSCVPRVIVVENPFARRPLPEDLFNGPFDERWHWIKENGAIDRIFVGSRLKELEELKNKS